MLSLTSRLFGNLSRLPSSRLTALQLPPTTNVFDPDEFPLIADDETRLDDDFEVDALEPKEEPATNKRSSRVALTEARKDGHAPIKTALSVLLHGLLEGRHTLSHVRVTLFNFHATTFAERLLSRNVSSLVLVESSQAFAKAAKQFAVNQRADFRNVDAYRADVGSLLGVGRKKLVNFPAKVLLAGRSHQGAKSPFRLTLGQDQQVRGKPQLPPPTILCVLPTESIQKSILDALMRHLLLHHGQLDGDTLFAYGAARLFTFLNCGLAAQLMSSTDPRLGFLSHHHRRQSALFNKLFRLSFLHQKTGPDGMSAPIGHAASSFHPPLAFPAKISHEKKLAEVNMDKNRVYAVCVEPKSHVSIGGKTVYNLGAWEQRQEVLPTRWLLAFGFFMTQVAKEPNGRPTFKVLSNLWPESTNSLLGELEELKIGQTADETLEAAFFTVREELESSRQFKKFVQELKIKRAVKEA